MKIRALKPFTLRDADTGELTSIACGQVATIDDTLGAQLISDGLAEAYTLISPTGTKTITANGESDVAEYAKALVAVPEPSGSENITANGTYDIKDKASVVVNVGTVTVSYDANGGTGTVDSQTVIAGNEVTLDTGAGLTPPEGKTFVGWAEGASSTEPVTTPFKPTANVTLYAIWEDEQTSDSTSE